MSTHTNIPNAAIRGHNPVFELIGQELEQVKKVINEQLVFDDCTGLTKGAEAMFLHLRMQACSGKMLRSGLLLLSYRAACNCPYAEKANSKICIAAIVEMIHYATLLHDDVIDNGQKRRRLPTVNTLWDNKSAVLLGDLLLSRVFRMCADLEQQVARTIAAATGQVCQGELRQILLQKQVRPLSESEYIDIIVDKTAVLFSTCCFLGGLLAKAGEKQMRSLTQFGRNFGIAFQITDDLLDVVGDENKAGKTLGSDVQKNHVTLPLIHLLAKVDEKEKASVMEKLNAGIGDKDALVDILKTHGSLEYAQNRAQEFVANAVTALTHLGKSDAKDALVETARFAIDRTF